MEALMDKILSSLDDISATVDRIAACNVTTTPLEKFPMVCCARRPNCAST